MKRRNFLKCVLGVAALPVVGLATAGTHKTVLPNPLAGRTGGKLYAGGRGGPKISGNSDPEAIWSQKLLNSFAKTLADDVDKDIIRRGLLSAF